MRTKVIISMLAMMFAMAGCSDEDSPSGTGGGSAPDMPTGLAVTDEGLNTISLSWDESSDATGYRLYRSDSVDGTYHLRYSGTATVFVDTNIRFVTPYYYRIAAENSHGESDPCTPVSGATTVPAGFTVTGTPGGYADATYNYLDEFNGHPRYQSDPIGIWISVPTGGDYAGQWVFWDMIEGLVLYYNTADSDYPPPSGYYARVGDARTSTSLAAF